MQNTVWSQIEYCKRELKIPVMSKNVKLIKRLHTLNKQPSLVKQKFSRQNLDEWLHSQVVVHDHPTDRENMAMKNRNLSWESFGGVGEGRGCGGCGGYGVAFFSLTLPSEFVGFKRYTIL